MVLITSVFRARRHSKDPRFACRTFRRQRIGKAYYSRPDSSRSARRPDCDATGRRGYRGAAGETHGSVFSRVLHNLLRAVTTRFQAAIPSPKPSDRSAEQPPPDRERHIYSATSRSKRMDRGCSQFMAGASYGSHQPNRA